LTVQNALQFLRRQRERLAAETGLSPSWASLADLLAQAERESLPFSEAELREAYRIDWSMRFTAGVQSPDPTSSSSD
jgi:hypothetical protein